MSNLREYVPDEFFDQTITIDESLAEVIARISQYLPPQLIWRLFASEPEMTGGVIKFPYCRIDSSVISARDVELSDLEEESRESYILSCESALAALLWVEVGFQGLSNLAVHPASVSWTTRVGHIMDKSEPDAMRIRAKRIMTKGKELYEECLRTFAQFRNINKEAIGEDCFDQFALGWLLDRFRDEE